MHLYGTLLPLDARFDQTEAKPRSLNPMRAAFFTAIERQQNALALCFPYARTAIADSNVQAIG